MRLRPLEARDATAFAEGTADPAVQRYGHLPEPVYTPESVRMMIERDATPGLQRGDLAVLAIADAETDALAGSLVIFDVSAHAAEVGFWMHPAHRGSGAAAVALELAARFAGASGLRDLTARTLPQNPASQRTLAAAGFTLERRGLDTTPSGDRVQLLHYGRTLYAEQRTGRGR
ncbi:MAG TPA: GNAT family N-acetyltransferase [Ruania sp.]|nr:GNAT family N-acetyltransferase [Ruania sp.]